MKDPREEKSVPLRTFDVDVTYVLTKKASVVTSDYELSEDFDGHTVVETKYTDWNAAYEEDHYTVKELLDMLSDYAKKELRMLPSQSQRAIELRNILHDCEGWNLDEYNYEEG